MEDINKKAHEDELNKSNEDIGKSPIRFIPVPKLKPKRNNIKNKGKNGK